MTYIGMCILVFRVSELEKLIVTDHAIALVTKAGIVHPNLGGIILHTAVLHDRNGCKRGIHGFNGDVCLRVLGTDSAVKCYIIVSKILGE